MDALQLLATTLGLGFASGLRLYSTVLALGLALRFHWITLPASMKGLDVLAHPAVLIAAGVAFLVEFVSDKIPWVDSLWDALHTIIRPVGAALLAFAAFGQMDPLARALLTIACGSVALSAHAAKTATRLAVNHSPEPFSNLALSLAGDFAVPFLLWVVSAHPFLAVVLVAAFLVVFLWLARKIWGVLRRGAGWLSRRFSSAAPETAE
ncbi:MAG: DUF4126 domain-containing protein [Acidobacteria bacterium]|nr:DUF4126 domain-containing protein [Acidobacteriota bacterium]